MFIITCFLLKPELNSIKPEIFWRIINKILSVKKNLYLFVNTPSSESHEKFNILFLTITRKIRKMKIAFKPALKFL